MELMYNLNINRIGDNMFEMDKINLPDSSGVYFVYNSKKELIYIGQTNNLLRRTIDHFRTDVWFKLFACYLSYVDCPIEDLKVLETERIQEFRPLFNFEHYSTPSEGDMREAVRNKPII